MNLHHSLGVGPQMMESAGRQDQKRSRNEYLCAARISLLAKRHSQLARDDRDDFACRMRMGLYFVPRRQPEAHREWSYLREIALKRREPGAGWQTCKRRPCKGVRLDDHTFGGVRQHRGLANQGD